MREDTVTIKVYPFDELSSGAKVNALERLAGINIHDEWWEFIYEDATTIGLKITEFNICGGSYCRGKWTEDAEAVAGLIQELHGEACETYMDATAFLADLKTAQAAFEADDPDYEEFADTDAHEELCQEFKRVICEDYRIILQQEYEYRGSEEQIIEAIKANEYEFTADGELYL